MSDVTFTKATVTIPGATTDRSGFVNAVGIGGDRALAVYDELAADHFFRSPDNGVTWSEVGAQTSAISFYDGRSLATTTDVILLATSGTADGAHANDPIVRSTDGGVTFSPVDTTGLFVADDLWEMRGFVDLGSNELLAYGRFMSQGVQGNHFLRSTDGGLSWSTPTTLPFTPTLGDDPDIVVRAWSAAYCGSDVVV